MLSGKPSRNFALVPALVGAAACLFFIRNSLGVFFFLLPLGFVGYGWGPKTLWSSLLFAITGNIVLTIFMGLSFRIPGGDMLWDIFYFASMAVSFAWIILPPDEKTAIVPGAYRLALGAAFSTIIFIGMFFRTFNNPVFYEFLYSQIEMIYSLTITAEGVQPQEAAALLPDIEIIMEMLKSIIVRGGALLSSVIILFINRQLSVMLIRIFGGPRRQSVFLNFHVYPRIFWALFFSFVLIFVTNMFAWEALGTICWNVLILCVLMYLAQGFGIIRYFMTWRGFPGFMRFAIPALFIILLFNSYINMIMLAAIIVLGIVENWVSFRSFNLNGPPSTPQA